MPDPNLPEPVAEDSLVQGTEASVPAAPPPSLQPAKEDPPWNGVDVIVLATVVALSVFLITPLAVTIAILLHVDGVSAGASASHQIPALLSDVRVLLPAQLMVYLVALVFMVQIVRRRYGSDFLPAIKWNWPAGHWPRFVLVGVVLAFAISVLTLFLPETKNLPIDTLFQGRRSAFLMAGFGILVAPFMEELFFRGFLYPVLVRRMGMLWAVALTAIAFTGIHVSQLAASWAPLLVLLCVGVVLTLVRASTQSVAASVLAHMGYNSALFAMLYFGTQGFRHLDQVTK